MDGIGSKMGGVKRSCHFDSFARFVRGRPRTVAWWCLSPLADYVL